MPARVREITGGRGADVALDCVASVDVLGDAHAALAKCGILITIGGAAGSPAFDVRQHLQKGVSYRGTHQGDAVPREIVPKLIELWRACEYLVISIVWTLDVEWSLHADQIPQQNCHSMVC